MNNILQVEENECWTKTHTVKTILVTYGLKQLLNQYQRML